MSRAPGTFSMILISLVCTACGEKRYTAKPGAVLDVQNPAGAMVGFHGLFELAEVTSGWESVPSDNPTGGACLVTQDTRYPKPCDTNADCKVQAYTDVDGKLHVPGDQAFGYCLPYHKTSLPKTCWMKPSKTHCVKGVGLGKHSTPTVTETEARAYLGNDSKLSWRVVACLNGNDADHTPPPPCGEQPPPPPGERVELAGKEVPLVTKVPTLPGPLKPPPGN